MLKSLFSKSRISLCLFSLIFIGSFAHAGLSGDVNAINTSSPESLAASEGAQANLNPNAQCSCRAQEAHGDTSTNPMTYEPRGAGTSKIPLNTGSVDGAATGL